MREDFSGGPVMKTLASSAGGGGSIPGQGAKIPTCLTAKKHKSEVISAALDRAEFGSSALKYRWPLKFSRPETHSDL